MTVQWGTSGWPRDTTPLILLNCAKLTQKIPWAVRPIDGVRYAWVLLDAAPSLCVGEGCVVAGVEFCDSRSARTLPTAALAAIEVELGA